jgi:hypothetical protein
VLGALGSVLPRAHDRGALHPVWQNPDVDTGRCLVPEIAALPIVCPQYTDDSCCTWEQNNVLYYNLNLLVQRCEPAEPVEECSTF